MRSYKKRSALTLIELIVVVAIIATLATITALYFPRFQDQEVVNRGADMLQGWLLIAKQQARRDGRATGLRLYVDVNTALSGKYHITRFRYIQQLPDFAQGTYYGSEAESGSAGAKAYFSLPNSLSFGGLDLPVQEGDYLVLAVDNKARRIKSAANQIIELDKGTTPLPGPTPPQSPAPAAGATNYRIVPMPRPVEGEQSLKFPENVGLDLDPASPTTSLSQNLPPNLASDSEDTSLPVGVPRHYDIVFSPAGTVLTQMASGGQIVLWVRNTTQNNASNILAGNPTLIAIGIRTGLIAAHPVATTGDYYSFTRDARSSGM